MSYNLILKGQEEFYPKLNNKIYNILKVDNKDKENNMILIINKFLQTSILNIDNKHFVGIDFEFNNVSRERIDVALMQINIENDSKDAYIFVINPEELNKDNHNILIKLLTTKNIIKILHGAESLDIPYLFKQFFKNKYEIDNFCNNFYDTKYLCEYSIIEDNINRKCSIYDLLLTYKIITEDKMNKLLKIEEDMGPIYNIKIDIHTMNMNIFKYSLYDVIYLPELIKKFLKKNIVYKNIIPEITCLIYKYKKNIENEFNNLYTIINQMNLYFIKEDNKNIQTKILLNDIYELFSFTTSDNNRYLDKLIEINYFKKFINIIMKLYIYNYIYNNYTVYTNNNNIYNNKLNVYINWLKKYPNINNLFNEFNNNIIL
jgi:hypothetical protein